MNNLTSKRLYTSYCHGALVVMSRIFFFILISTPLSSFAQPSTEVFLFDLHSKKDKITIDNGKNVSAHPGYDNQPYLSPTGTVLYYTSEGNDGKTDIMVYDYTSGKTVPLVTTPEGEFSPTVTPDGKFVSCIIQRENGAQDLGKYPIAGGKAEVIVDNLTVGYHAWIDSQNLILFVLGEQSTLHRINPSSGQDSIIASNIGRSLHRIPKDDAMSFVQKSDNGDWTICRLDIRTNKITVLTKTIAKRDDLTWTPDGTLVMSDGQKLYGYRPGKDSAWKELLIKTDLPLKGISRINVSAKGDKIAIVAEE
jgi:Tol biopolymer transport system component